MMLLKKADITSALNALGEAAAADENQIHLLLLGGAAMSLVFDNRDSTRDVDVVFLAPEDSAYIRRLAVSVADRLGLPMDWLNDGAKGYVRPPVHEKVVFEAPGILVTIPSLEQMAAMKLSAWRDDIDIGDAELIITALKAGDRSRDQVWQTIENYIVPGQELKARYAFEELWETL